jgi:transposase
MSPGEYCLSNDILLCFRIVFVATRAIGGKHERLPKCTHPHVVKAGKARGTQRWLCRGCGYQFTRTMPRGRPRWQKSLAVFLYCHGISINALGKIFGVRASSVLKWIRRYAADRAEKPAPSGKAIVLEVDEMWHFLKKNGTSSGSGRLLIVIQATSLTGSVGVVMQQP